MPGHCTVEINDFPILPTSILNCYIRESIVGMPDGEVTIRDKDGFLDEIIRIPTFSKIKVRMYSYQEDIVKTESTNDITFTGIVTNIIVSDLDIDNYGSNVRTFKISFMYDNGNRAYLALMPSLAYSGSSVDVISSICKKAGIDFKKDSIVSSDYMKWLICNKNAYQAITMVAERSFVSTSDILLYYISLNGTLNIKSLYSIFDNPRDIVYNYVRGDASMNVPVDYEYNSSIKQYKFLSYSFVHSGYKVSLSSSLNKEVNDIMGGSKFANKVTESISAINSTMNSTSANGIGHLNSGDVKNNFFKNKQIVSSSINTHANYGIAPLIRDAILSKFSNMVNLVLSGESDTAVGDCINVFFPSNLPGTKIQDVTSGKYLITDKIHEYNIYNKTYLNKTFCIKDFMNYDKSKYYEYFGINPSEVA